MEKTVEFIIPTYYRPRELKSMLASLCAQHSDNWLATVVIDGYDWAEDVELLVGSFWEKRIRCINLEKRFNDWGHTPRQIGKNQSRGDYTIMTGDDNYYMPTLVTSITPLMEAGIDFIYWDMIHSHYGYTLFKTSPYMNQIDMGAFAFKTEMGKQIDLTTAYAADGIFVNDFHVKFPEAKYQKIDRVLFVHN